MEHRILQIKEYGRIEITLRQMDARGSPATGWHA